MQIEIRDNVIWNKQLLADQRLSGVIATLGEGETIRLSVDGINGEWMKMRTGKDGRPTQGIKPVGPMANVWKRWQARRGEKVDVRWPGDEDDPLLRLADMTFLEWYSAADEEAFGELSTI